MPIYFRCTECGREYADLPDEAAGKKVRCECGVKMVLPESPAEGESPEPTAGPDFAFDPAAPNEPTPPVAPTPKPRPPRTLDQAARAAAKPPEPSPPPAPPQSAPPQSEPPAPPVQDEILAALVKETAPEPVLEIKPSVAVEPASAPPPLPPAGLTSGAPLTTSAATEKRYRNLRVYCGWLRLTAWLVLGIGVLVSMAGVLSVFATSFGMPAVSIASGGSLFALVFGLAFSAVPAVAGFAGFVFLNAAAEFFHVQMDIEENTRR